MARKPIDVKTAIFFAEAKIKERLQQGESIPRFSKKYETIVDYLKSKEFSESKPAYQNRVIKQALNHPTWTLDEARGHSKPTGHKWDFFDKKGRFEGRVEFKNRKEETKYAEYLNALKDYLEAGNEQKLKDWQKAWGKEGKHFITKDGVKHKVVLDKETLNRLAHFDELPTGDDVYEK